MTVTTEIPAIVSRYIAAAAADDIPTLVECFTKDAEVVDEAETRHGHAGIKRWREEVASKYTYTTTVLGSRNEAADEWLVSTRLEGNFPGGVADLAYRFTLSDGLISRLEID